MQNVSLFKWIPSSYKLNMTETGKTPMASHDPKAMREGARADFVAAMRGVANSVTIVTTDGPAGRCGATVSAFASVSADPPMVLVCLHAQSTIAALAQENGVFCVNVLPEGAGELAVRFAGATETP